MMVRSNKDMMDAIFDAMEPGVAHTCEFRPVILSQRTHHIAHLPFGEGKSFSIGDPTSSMSATSGQQTQMPLSALPSMVLPHQIASQRQGSSSTLSLP